MFKRRKYGKWTTEKIEAELEEYQIVLAKLEGNPTVGKSIVDKVNIDIRKLELELKRRKRREDLK